MSNLTGEFIRGFDSNFYVRLDKWGGIGALRGLCHLSAGMILGKQVALLTVAAVGKAGSLAAYCINEPEVSDSLNDMGNRYWSSVKEGFHKDVTNSVGLIATGLILEGIEDYVALQAEEITGYCIDKLATDTLNAVRFTTPSENPFDHGIYSICDQGCRESILQTGKRVITQIQRSTISINTDFARTYFRTLIQRTVNI